MTLERTFADALRGRRAEANLSQGELGAAIGVSGSAVGNWERGEDEPSRANVAALERALGLEPGDLSRHLGYGPADAVPTQQQLMEMVQALSAQVQTMSQQLDRLLEERDG